MSDDRQRASDEWTAMNKQRTQQAALEQAVAQLWCLPQHSHKEMDVEFTKSIVALLAARRAAVLEEVATHFQQSAKDYRSYAKEFINDDEAVQTYGPVIRLIDAEITWLRKQAQEQRP